MADISIANIAPTDANAKALRAVNKYGMHLADFAALTTSSSFTGFGNGTGYTVGNWVSDGVFASVAAAQAVYPIIQDGNDHVDWVLMQSAVDFLLYGALGSANRQNMKRKLFLPAGWFLLNRTLHIGYCRIATPPADLNGNGYVSISIEGEGPQTDPQSGSGMTGTTILTEGLTYPGIAVAGYQQVNLKGFTLDGPYRSYMEGFAPYRDDDNWDRTAWRDTGIADANWLDGDAVNIGIGMDLYSTPESAAAYPARILPSYFGGGTSTAGFPSAGGTELNCDNINIRGYIIGAGRPHGDGNGEFFRFNRCNFWANVHGFVSAHSQQRNISMTDVNFEIGHTAITSQGGTQGNANLHGTWKNIHVGRHFQIIDHPAADWSGPMVIENIYAESFFRIGTFSTGILMFKGGFLSSLDQEGTHGSVYNHVEAGHLILDGCYFRGRDGIFSSPEGGSIHVLNGTIMTGQESVLTNANAILGVSYMGSIFSAPGSNVRTLGNSDYSHGRFGHASGKNDGSNRDMTFVDQEWVEYYSQYTNGAVHNQGVTEQVGSVFRYPVPKIARWTVNTSISARSGLDVTATRNGHGDIPYDLGDVVALKPDTDTATTDYTWFVVHGISGSNMTLRQLNNFAGDTTYDYRTNGREQITASVSYNNRTYAICTRVRRNQMLFFGEVASGSAVISNVRMAFQGASDMFTDANFDMAAGDYFLHQEPQRAATGAATKVANLVSSIDFTANTITLTQTFNITDTKYPIVFFVRQYNP